MEFATMGEEKGPGQTDPALDQCPGGTEAGAAGEGEPGREQRSSCIRKMGGLLWAAFHCLEGAYSLKKHSRQLDR